MHTTSELWMHPYGAQPDHFLQLHYVNHCGVPEGATTSLYLHPWAQHDQIGLAADLEITRAEDDGLIVCINTYSWSVFSGPGSLAGT